MIVLGAYRTRTGRVTQWTTAAAGFVCIFATAIAASQPPRTRVIRWDPRLALADRVIAGDDVVVVTREYEGGGLVRRPTFEEAVAFFRETDLIAVVHIDEVRPVLVDEGSWIRTLLEGRVEQVTLATPDPPRRLRMYRDGGRVQLGQAQVETRGFLTARAGEAYLLFMNGRDDEGRWRVVAMLRVDGGRLRPTWAPDMVSRGRERPVDQGYDTPNALVGHTLADVMARLQKAERRP